MLWIDLVMFQFKWFFFLSLKVGTLCWPACLSGSRLKSKRWFPPTWERASTWQAPRTETSLCGVEEQCWQTCPLSALRGSARKNMRSTDRRSSLGSASDTDCCKVCVPDSCVMYSLSLYFTKCNIHKSQTVPWISPLFFKMSVLCIDEFGSTFVITLDPDLLTWHQQVSIDPLLASWLICWDPPACKDEIYVIKFLLKCVVGFPVWECISVSQEFKHKYINVCG